MRLNPSRVLLCLGSCRETKKSPPYLRSALQAICNLHAVCLQFFVRLHVRWGEGRWLGVGRERRLRYRGLRKSLRCRIAERTIKFRQKGASTRAEGVFFMMPLLFLSAASLKISRSRLHADPHTVAGTSFQTAFRRFSNPFFFGRENLSPLLIFADVSTFRVDELEGCRPLCNHNQMIL